MTSAALSVSFRQDSLTTASKATLEKMAQTLGFTQNQTVLFALARLRDELQQQASSTISSQAAMSAYPPLQAHELGIIRKQALKRRSKPVRRANIADLL
jgi:hypothetical protein